MEKWKKSSLSFSLFYSGAAGRDNECAWSSSFLSRLLLIFSP